MSDKLMVPEGYWLKSASRDETRWELWQKERTSYEKQCFYRCIKKNALDGYVLYHGQEPVLFPIDTLQDAIYHACNSIEAEMVRKGHQEVARMFPGEVVGDPIIDDDIYAHGNSMILDELDCFPAPFVGLMIPRHKGAQKLPSPEYAHMAIKENVHGTICNLVMASKIDKYGVARHIVGHLVHRLERCQAEKQRLIKDVEELKETVIEKFSEFC